MQRDTGAKMPHMARHSGVRGWESAESGVRGGRSHRPPPACLTWVHRRVRGSLLRASAGAGAAGHARGHQDPQSRLHGATAAGLSE